MSEESEVNRAVVTPARVVIALCLVAPFVAMLWVIISTALTMTAYKLWQRDQRARTSQGGGASK
ncbi:MAG: hypothetical protein QOC85_1613 [Streptomyces sp.]|nr:hypothetical protein [Streptomyces sp.]